MITVICKFQPLTAVLIGALLYAIYYFALRLKTSSVVSQRFIGVAVVAVTLFTFVTPARLVDRQPTAAAYTPSAAAPVAQPAAAPAAATQQPAATQVAAAPTPRVGHLSLSLAEVDSPRLFLAAYALGVVLMLAYFVAQLLWCARVRRRCTKASVTSEATIYDTDFAQPFSFARSIFLPVVLTGELRHYVITHELCHIRHRHFLKLCLLELLLAVNWFNPFVWLFFNEQKLQQELQVDNDVLAQGVDRERYQLSLLQVAIRHSRWLMVQSAFGNKPIKQRILFMNKSISARSIRRRLMAAAVTATVVVAAAATIGCMGNEKAVADTARHHDIYGVWQMDFYRRAGSQRENYPPFRQYAFYGDDMFFTPSFSSREGHNFSFGFSGEALSMRGDTLLGGYGFPMAYRYVGERTIQCDWVAGGGDLAQAGGNVNTDQWSRATPEAEFLAPFHAASKAAPSAASPLDGVWHTADLGGDDGYLMISNGLMVLMVYHGSSDPNVLYFSGRGDCGDVEYGGGTDLKMGGTDFTIEWAADKQSFKLTVADPAQSEVWQRGVSFSRIAMPDHIARIMRTTLIENPA